MAARICGRRLLQNFAVFVMPILLMNIVTRSALATTYTFTDLFTLGVPSGFNIETFHDDYQPIASAGSVLGWGVGPDSHYHALLWKGASMPVALNSAGLDSTYGYGISGGQQVGSGLPNAGGQFHAMLWNGTNAAVDLNPSGFIQSEAFATSGGQQVGEGYGTLTSGSNHALLWNGTNAAIDLNPSTFARSWATCTDGTQQVGYGWGSFTASRDHALLWTGTNAAIDLNPAGATESDAYAVSGGLQVGSGDGHALLWNGTNVATDLNPAGFGSSEAHGVLNGQEVGWGQGTVTSNHIHALLWNGNNAAIDLGTLLPATFFQSYAYTLDSGGNVFGLALDTNNNWHAVEWSVPEPTTLSLVILGAITICRRRCRIW